MQPSQVDVAKSYLLQKQAHWNTGLVTVVVGSAHLQEVLVAMVTVAMVMLQN